MNANLDKEQIEYIQSIIGKTDYEYNCGMLDEDELRDVFITDKEWNDYYAKWESIEKESDEYWYDLILDKGKSVLDRNHDKHRHYTIYNSILKLGDRYFEVMNCDPHNEQQEFSDIVNDYGDWSYDVTEVYPKEVVTIDYSYIKD